MDPAQSKDLARFSASFAALDKDVNTRLEIGTIGTAFVLRLTPGVIWENRKAVDVPLSEQQYQELLSFRSGNEEIELKYLLQDVPEEFIKGASGKKLWQGILALGNDGSMARIRDSEGCFVLTLKSGFGRVLIKVTDTVRSVSEGFESVGRVGARKRKRTTIILAEARETFFADPKRIPEQPAPDKKSEILNLASRDWKESSN